MQRRSFLIAGLSFILAISIAAQEKAKLEIVDTHTLLSGYMSNKVNCL